MEILSSIVIFIVKTLIIIGDLVLFFIKLFISALRLPLQAAKTSLKKPQRKTAALKQLFSKIWNNILNKPIFIKEKKPVNQIDKQPQPKIIRKQKPIVIFPIPFFVKFKFFIAGTIFSLIFIFIPLLFMIFIQNLPSPKELTGRQIPQTTKIYDRNSILLYQIYATQNRTIVPLSNVPRYLRDATIAVEDKDFYKHPGFDVKAIMRSAFENFSGRGLQGGSTITQQLVKSALLTPEATISRKIKEVILAFWAERIYTKNQILELYFNQIPYGGTAWGIEAASDVYFGKHVQDLNLAQSAFLAGIPKAPSIYSPYSNKPNIWKKRQKEVLDRMTALGYISSKQARQAFAEQLKFHSPQVPIHAPHFVMYVREILEKRYGLAVVEKGGLSVTTSIDLKLSEKVQKIVSKEVQRNKYLNLTNGAALVTNPSTGDILAMIGSKNFDDESNGNVNITTSLRQPGSSIKIVTYSGALGSGFTPATILDDSPVVFPGIPPYRPVNYDGKFHGKVSLRMALANSFNIPAVKVLNNMGVSTMVDLGKRMGIKSWGDSSQYGLSITLGGADVTMLDMATAYGVLANQGYRVDLNPILNITDSKGNILETKDNPNKYPVFNEGIAFIISNILADNQARTLEFGPNSPLSIPGHTVPVKTGTSDNKRDNWTIGYTKSYVTTVWVGNNDNSPMSQQLASGITGAAPIWNSIMKMLISNSPDQTPPLPANVIAKPCIGRIEYFIKGTENSVNCKFIPSPSVSLSPSRSR